MKMGRFSPERLWRGSRHTSLIHPLIEEQGHIRAGLPLPFWERGKYRKVRAGTFSMTLVFSFLIEVKFT